MLFYFLGSSRTIFKGCHFIFLPKYKNQNLRSKLFLDFKTYGAWIIISEMHSLLKILLPGELWITREWKVAILWLYKCTVQYQEIILSLALFGCNFLLFWLSKRKHYFCAKYIVRKNCTLNTLIRLIIIVQPCWNFKEQIELFVL